MSHYLDDPEMTAETIVDGWLMTGDLGRFDSTGHLQLFGRKKNMIVTDEGKNIYPEDMETVFEGLPVKEFCVFAANYLWPARTMVGEKLVIVLQPEAGQPFTPEMRANLEERNRRLVNYKRIQRLFTLGTGFSADRGDEDQARRVGRRNPRGGVADGGGVILVLFRESHGGERCRTLRPPFPESGRVGHPKKRTASNR